MPKGSGSNGPEDRDRLERKVTRLEAAERRHRQTREALQKRTHALAERVKELNCLYALSSLVERHGASLNRILRDAVNVVASAWQYPEVTRVRITAAGQEIASRGFRETPWKQAANIPVKGRTVGSLEVCYLEERPPSDEGPFLREERSLINALALRIGEIVERKEAEDALRESMTRNKALLRAIPDMIFRIDSEGTILDVKKGKGFPAIPPVKHLLNASIREVSNRMLRLPNEAAEQWMRRIGEVLRTGETQVYEQVVPRRGRLSHYEILLTVSGRNEVLGIVRDITERRRLEMQVIEISEREQQRIGQDLHDSLCQQLAGLGFIGKVLEQKLLPEMPEAASDAAEIVSVIDEAITQTKALARGLYPVRLEAGGLITALTELCRTVERFFGITCRFEYSEPPPSLEGIMAVHLYRITQEAVSNAVKHGKAGRILVTLRRDDGMVTLAVANDGLPLPRNLREKAGMGLSIMRHRAAMIGASLEIRGDQETGTVVSCTFQPENTERSREQ